MRSALASAACASGLTVPFEEMLRPVALRRSAWRCQPCGDEAIEAAGRVEGDEARRCLAVIGAQ